MVKPLGVADYQETLAAVRRIGTVRGAADFLGIQESGVRWRLGMAARQGISWSGGQEWTYPQCLAWNLRDGLAVVCSDLHRWPGPPPPMLEALHSICHALVPDVIVLNGDMLDGARVSRHSRIRHSMPPKIKEEIGQLKLDLGALPLGPKRFWCLGNHDKRVDDYVAINATELEDCSLALPQEFPDWEFAYAVVLGEGCEVRHRWNRGVHAAYNNALRSGGSMVTGDTHRLAWTPIEGRFGRRFGVECGMLADPGDRAFEYTEGVPTRWTPGFAVLSFDDQGNLLTPELVEWLNGRAWFRGKRVG